MPRPLPPPTAKQQHQILSGMCAAGSHLAVPCQCNMINAQERGVIPTQRSTPSPSGQINLCEEKASSQGCQICSRLDQEILHARRGRKNRMVRLLSPCHAECSLLSVRWPGREGCSRPQPSGSWLASLLCGQCPGWAAGASGEWRRQSTAGLRGVAWEVVPLRLALHRASARASQGAASLWSPEVHMPGRSEQVGRVGGWGEEPLPQTVERGRRLPGPVGAAWAGPVLRLVLSRGPGWPAAGSCWPGRKCWATLLGRHTRRRTRCQGPRCLRGVQCQRQPLCGTSCLEMPCQSRLEAGDAGCLPG